MTIETIQKDNDTLYRFIFQEKAMRGEWVRLNDTFAECLHHHNYPTVVRNLLGEMLVATSLLTATLKFDGDITFQIQGDGPVRLALVNGNNSQQMRALARLSDDVNEDMTLHQLVGKAVLVISITPKQGERYQGVVALDKPTISECIQDYFERSEQLPSNLVIRIGEWQGKPVAAGLLLQVLPSEEHNKEISTIYIYLLKQLRMKSYLNFLLKSYSTAFTMKRPLKFLNQVQQAFSVGALKSVQVVHYFYFQKRS